MTASPLDAVLTSCRIEPVWFIRIAVMEAVALDYGAFYDKVCFESGTGTEF